MRFRKHLSYANVTSTLALVLAIGTGGVYAAERIRSQQIENNSIASQDLRDRRAVSGIDVRKDTLGAREINERALTGSRIVDLKAEQDPNCVLDSGTFVDCVSIPVSASRPSRLLATAAGGFVSNADGANAECEVRLDDADEAIGQAPGEITDNTQSGSSDGFARTAVFELDPGPHTVALACQQIGPEAASIESPSISTITVVTRGP